MKIATIISKHCIKSATKLVTLFLLIPCFIFNPLKPSLGGRCHEVTDEGI